MSLKTVNKALEVLRFIVREKSPLTTTELSQCLDINISTMSRLLDSLRAYDFIEQDHISRRYKLGPAAAEMARAVDHYLKGNIVNIAAPYINELRDQLDETIALEILTGNNLYHAYIANTTKQVCLKVELGDRVMPHAHVGSKAIIAHCEPQEIDYWLHQNLISYTRNTITDPEKLLDSYKMIRQTGIAFDYGEYVEEIQAIGSPIFNHENKPVAGLVVAMVAARKKKWPAKYLRQLKATANTISENLNSTRNVPLEIGNCLTQ